ncbi:MAG: hypothetical protein AB8G77_26920 [Rhodothermales bacterium]
MRTVFFAFIIFSIPWATHVLAQENEIELAEEVFWAELVHPQEKGEFQISLSPWISTSAQPNIGQSPFSLEYGISDAWQLEAEWSGPGYGNESFESALEFGTKYSFLNLFDAGFHAAIGSEIAFTVSEEGFETEPFVILAKDFPQLANLHLFSQAGLEFESSSEEEEELESPGWSLHIGAILPVKQFYLSAEMGWMHEEGDMQMYITPGAVFEVIDDFQIGVGIPIGISDYADTFRIATFFTYEFELFERD